ncbi:PQQ-dependent sugar dehydrogenase [Spirosoma soli]|uniref:PQQ-dependent sugar dehydrogenase n=1 Tax=Spirosoma soli TaxID=1770529 RepID=A0ABW5M0Z6_9BACT
MLASLLLSSLLLSSFPTDTISDYYEVETIATPPGLVAETGGLSFLPDGRMAACFHRGEVMLYNPKTKTWKLFAEGLHDPLGVVAINNCELLVVQRPELTRITDTDGDGVADLYQTVTDQFGMSGNYHEFAFGPVRDAKGNLYISLNTASNGAGIRDEVRGQYDALGRQGRMYACVPYRGWVMQITPEGKVKPYASGFRSPNGIGFDAQGRLFVTDNQGDWLGTSKLYHVEEGKFYGHPASLVWRPGFPNIDPLTLPVATLDSMRTVESIAFPHEMMAHSPTQIAFDNTGGKFGPFSGQLFVGEMDFPHLLRVLPDEVDGSIQGACLPFFDKAGSGRTKLRIGNNRLAFAPDGSLYLGQADHGWLGDRGIQRIRYKGQQTGVGIPLDILAMKLTPTGFDLTFTQPVDEPTANDLANYRFRSYYYEYHQAYGSPQMDTRSVAVSGVRLSADHKTVSLTLTELKPNRIYELTLGDLRADKGQKKRMNRLVCYTLNKLVRQPRQEP